MGELWSNFGEFDSAEEINKAAEGLKNEGDKENLLKLAEENGIDRLDAQDYINGDLPELTGVIDAALGKLKKEAEAAGLPEDSLINDWIGYIRSLASEDAEAARNIRKKGKKLTGCIGAVMEEAFMNQWTVPNDLKKAAGITAGKVTFGIPGMAKVKEIIKDYYGGGK